MLRPRFKYAINDLEKRRIEINNETNNYNVVLLNDQSTPKGCRLYSRIGGGAKATIPHDLKLSITKEIDSSILKGMNQQIYKLQISLNYFVINQNLID